MSKYTPGPWEVSGHEPNTTVIRPVGSIINIAIMHVSPSSPAFEERRANAHLIAAAPDLLEALKSVQNLVWNSCSYVDRHDKTRTLFDDERGDLFRQVSSAIAKAEGSAS